MTLTSTGPGSANMVMSLATALSDSSAFLAITADVPTSQMNRGPFQELYKHNQADFPSVMRPVVKRSFQPSRVDMLPLALRQAMDTMVTGRPVRYARTAAGPNSGKISARRAPRVDPMVALRYE